MSARPCTLLVVEEADSNQAELTRALEPGERVLRRIPPGPEVMRLAAEVDLVLFHAPGCPSTMRPLVDRLLPQVEGGPSTPVLVVARRECMRPWLEVLRRGAEVVFDPYDGDELSARVDRLLDAQARLKRLAGQVGELQRLSSTDGLTGVHNHRHFQERLRDEFRRAQRYDDPLSLILLDLDHFKQVNDRYGHTAGDGVLREVAAALQRGVRETDLVARYGGEEFAVLLPRTHLTGALTVAERVRRELALLEVGPDGRLKVTASLGVSSFPHRTVLSPEQLLLTADEALYRAKADGRDRISLHTPLTLFPPPGPRDE
ncbi:GGDEF domain-containing protein [Myxococcus stipitatus]|uniref:GGDEF domain-containing protein n=1 Tax=Myxococcus stipitatus TaxID=83455 RepID=UPI001F381DEB|nr:GGDEF domain-containing protein [Myxococcus stipitatus]MCE9667799.1 GGDEF domain-containing protein [Myxococcus stipitatus]